MPVEIDAIQDAKAIGWTDIRLSRLAANSASLNGRLSLNPVANASAMSVAGYSLTGADATSMLSLAGTWNTSGTPTALDLNVTDTASNAASLLMDLRVGGESVTRFPKRGGYIIQSGLTNFEMYSPTQGQLRIGHENVAHAIFWTDPAWRFTSTLPLQWATTTPDGGFDLAILRDAANTLGQRNGANAQAFNIYNTFTDASNFERGFMRWSSNVLQIGTEAGGTGTHRNILFNATADYSFVTGTLPGTERFGISTTAIRVRQSVVPTVNIVDLGFNGSTGNTHRFRDLFIAPSSSLTPTTNGQLCIEATNNTTLTFKLRGSDAVVRSGTITLA